MEVYNLHQYWLVYIVVKPFCLLIVRRSVTSLFAHHVNKKITKRMMDRRPKKSRPSDINRNNINQDKCITKVDSAFYTWVLNKLFLIEDYCLHLLVRFYEVMRQANRSFVVETHNLRCFLPWEQHMLASQPAKSNLIE